MDQFFLNPIARSKTGHFMRIIVSICFFMLLTITLGAQGFVKRKGYQFTLNERPYYYIGTNYWYGTVLPLEKDPQRGMERLRQELDFLKSKGIDNLRVMAGAEGSGLVNGVERVGPPL